EEWEGLNPAPRAFCTVPLLKNCSSLDSEGENRFAVSLAPPQSACYSACVRAVCERVSHLTE
ncbi:hypothetical protein H671_21184, partial [Cricetulus griseus]